VNLEKIVTFLGKDTFGISKLRLITRLRNRFKNHPSRSVVLSSAQSRS